MSEAVEPQPGERRNWELLKRVWPFARRQVRLFILALVLLPPLATASAIGPILIQRAIDGPAKTGDMGLLHWLAFLFALTVLVRLGLQAWQGYLLQQAGQRMTADIRSALFDHVTRLSSSYFSRTPVGKLITRLTSDVEALGEVFSTGGVGILSDAVSIVIVAAFMFTLRWDLALVVVILLFPITAIVIWFQNTYRAANSRVREALSNLNAILQENLIGVNVVQMFRREGRNAEQFDRVNRGYIKSVDETILYDSALSAVMEWISLVAIAGVLWFGGGQVLQNAITFGTLVAFIQYAQRLFDPIRQLGERFTSIQSGFTSLERITDILDEPIEIKDQDKPLQLPADGTGEVTFQNVWFAYKADEYVLKNVSFTIKPGQTVALVGPTGSGKSTIIRLLCRLYEPTQGRILIDGVDIQLIAQEELRRRIGVILQEGFLFSGDINSNIALGEPFSEEEIQQAARAMNVDRFIRELPNGYKTQVRERGNNLSGGQKQLLAFARAAVRNPRILILDEATASLDVGTESLIQQDLGRLLEGRTCIMIAHRLSTIRDVDRILVLRKGELIEDGSHEQLLAQHGLYESLYKLQALAS
ncbi:ABC transporter ATP-binding protein [Gloeobacter violaceus]|uniref:HlyB/MsbA family ABC transporter n=1 Tax=Gloeobacter violaceus (strain ATCC 29082 / PCC 7421) TaxID=251221 RepID=Q7NCV8_GLOVI|nr:ABC transporter ATP-binding protein [Gloeobacter violaceus]BAC90809.1 HlyB/MsbA family ABC transporter [Gloeobacter violaceus PCC 7421]